MRILRASDHRTMPWKNGGGSTTEIAVAPDGAGIDAFDWRISMAVVAADGPFSAFPGCERSLTLLAGAGMALQFADRHCDLRPPYATCRFAGEQTPECVLFDGPTVDFNAIWCRDAISITVERRAMHGSLWCLPELGVSWFVLLLSGCLALKDQEHAPQISVGDGLWLQPEANAPRLMLEGFGEALWLKIERL